MLHLGIKIKNLVEKSSYSNKDFAEKLGKTEQALYDIFKKADINTSLLKKIAEILKVPVSSFFEEQQLRYIEEGNTVKTVEDKATGYEPLKETVYLKKQIYLLEQNMQLKDKLLNVYELQLEDCKELKKLIKK
jgi:transcriptional regulator with XRE-family HTH domain